MLYFFCYNNNNRTDLNIETKAPTYPRKNYKRSLQFD